MIVSPLHKLDIDKQPDDTSCGPTCLQAVYRYYGDNVSIESLIEDIPSVETGGTLSVNLGIHALQRGYKALMFTYNLQVFDPTWFNLKQRELIEKLEIAEAQCQEIKKREAIRSYRFFLELGGRIKMQDLSVSLLRHYLKKDLPILTGLSSTYLYQCQRELPDTCEEDDLKGEPTGHFVLLTGYDKDQKVAWVADPYSEHPMAESNPYPVPLDRLATAILLGVLTYDGNLLIIQPR